MSNLNAESAKDIITFNQQKLYHLSEKKYPNLKGYLRGSLYYTLLDLMRFIKSIDLMFYHHKYVFFLDNFRLTYKVRKKWGTATSSRHINLLCAIGLINKQYQNDEQMLKINQHFLQDNPDKKRPINAFYIRRLTDQELQRCEQRAAALIAAGVTSGNISFNKLMLNGLQDIATEVFPMNDRNAPSKKENEFLQMITLINLLIEVYGYASREQIKDNLEFSDVEIDKLFKIFRNQLKELFDYKKPTDEQMEQWDLVTRNYIYIDKRSE